MITCPQCQSQQPDGASFCDKCGASLAGATAVPQGLGAVPGVPAGGAAVCPACGAPVTPGEAFCDSCGAALSQTPVAAPPQVAPPVAPPVMPTAAPAVGAPAVCPICGSALAPGSAFCDMCGNPVAAAGPQVPPQPIPQQVPPQMPLVQPRFVIEGTNATLPFPPGKTEIIVGREDPVSNIFPEVDLTDHGGDEGGVSRQHAKITILGAQCFIEDLNSTNFTYVNKQKLTPGQRQALTNGAEVRFGRVKATFYMG
jgi:hypothetical protein